MRRARRLEDDGGIDLVPVMNVVALLVPLLLGASQARLGALHTALPAGRELPAGELPLAVEVTWDGFVVRGTGETDGAVPCARGCEAPDDWDYAGLVDRLVRVKDRWPAEDDLLLLAAADVPYEVVVRVMDVARADAGGVPLFPYVIVGTGEPR